MPVKQIFQRVFISQYLWVILSFPIILIIMKFAGIGCAGMLCSARAYTYAAQLILACFAFGAVGALLSISLNLFSLDNTGKSLPTIALWILLGQVATVLYIYIRSGFNHYIFDIQITKFEVWALVLIAIYLFHRKLTPDGRANFFDKKRIPTFALQSVVIAVLCIVVADREVPRLVMLSSDPDVHAFFARQIQRFGGIPYEQRGWGSEALNYPAGSGALIYAWSLFGFLDVRNVLAALPVLLTFFAALAMAERVIVKLQTISQQIIVLLFVLALTAAGFVLPLYLQFSHLEGTGRQLSIAFCALFLVLCTDNIATDGMKERNSAIAISLVIFTLAVLNPINFLLPVILAGAASIYIYITHCRKPVLILAPIGGVSLLLLEPYFTGLIGLSKAGALKLSLSPNLIIKSPSMWLMDTLIIYKTQFKILLSHFAGLFQFQAFPVFAILALAFTASVILLAKRYTLKAMLVGLLLAIFLIFFDGALMGLANDRRFYLLQPYFNVSMGQYKGLVLTFLGAWIVVMAFGRKISSIAIFGMCICMIMMSAVTIDAAQQIRHVPRQAYCGSMGCYEQTDLEVLKRFEEMYATGAIPKVGANWPRVLTPNVVGDFGLEKWIFPVSSSRALPFYDALPAAFYYYQGEAYYTTDNYVKHVCNYFDRDWLKARNINYIFLPMNRDSACIAGLSTLPQTEEVIIRSGDTYLLKIK